MKGRQISHLALMMVISGASAIYSQEMFPSRQLTTDSAREGFPSWSPDGQTVVYFFIHSIDGQQLLGSLKISSKGGEPIQFTDFPTEHP